MICARGRYSMAMVCAAACVLAGCTGLVKLSIKSASGGVVKITCDDSDTSDTATCRFRNRGGAAACFELHVKCKDGGGGREVRHVLANEVGTAALFCSGPLSRDEEKTLVVNRGPSRFLPPIEDVASCKRARFVRR